MRLLQKQPDFFDFTRSEPQIFETLPLPHVSANCRHGVEQVFMLPDQEFDLTCEALHFQLGLTVGFDDIGVFCEKATSFDLFLDDPAQIRQPHSHVIFLPQCFKPTLNRGHRTNLIGGVRPVS
jgi:hypothetical protein